MDLVIALLLLVFLAPVLVLCALAVYADSRGPILYRQQRVGKNGKLFTIFKFRSMFVDSDTTLHREYVTKFIHGEAEGAQADEGGVFKIVGDRRVTRSGQWLRRTSLDELPQLWNVLRGEMSLVGPRPPLPYEVAEYSPEHLQRLMVDQGITGWWQVYGRSTASFEEMVAMDLEYIRRQSIRVDITLLVRTLPVVLFGRGAF